MLTFLLVILGVAVVAVFVWNFRRQAAAREAASAERMKAFLERARAEAAGRSPAPPAAEASASTIPAAPTAAKVARAQPSAPVTGYVPHAPMLDAQQHALYQSLRRELPDHEIFACVSLAAFIRCADNITGFAREAQERRLGDTVADFVVCDRAMQPLAVVQCGTRNGKAEERAAFAAACAAAVGLRWVELSPEGLPQADALRGQVLGV